MNLQIEAILDKADKSLAAAKLLLDQNYLDFATSRAYYSMFFTTEALLSQRGLLFSSHSTVIAAYRREFSKTKDLESKFHKYLVAAQDFRSQGNYDYGPGGAESHAKNVIEWDFEFLVVAKDFINKV